MSKSVLVIGGTGHVGSKVVRILRERGIPVRALVREGSNASTLEAQGVTIVRGDMMKPQTLDAAFSGTDVAISCAAGYTGRRKSDTAATDRVGNRNLAEAAKRSGLKRFVLNSILQCDDAPGVGHFEDKAAAEASLRELGVPFVALRPGAFLDQSNDFAAKNALKGQYMGMGDRDRTRWTYVYTEDLAKNLVDAAFADERVVGKSIDVGWSSGPVTNEELAKAIGNAAGKELSLRIIPWWLLSPVVKLGGRLSPKLRDLGGMFLYFRTGRYVANLTLHEQLLGPSPTMNDAVQRWARATRVLREK